MKFKLQTFSSPNFSEQLLGIYEQKWEVEHMISHNLSPANIDHTMVSSKSFVNIRNLILPGHDLFSLLQFSFLKTDQCEEKTNNN